MGIKDFFKKLKEDNQGFLSTMSRMNGAGLLGEVNHGIKDGDFWDGAYVNLEKGKNDGKEKGVIYGSAQKDYWFTKEDITDISLVEKEKLYDEPVINQGQNKVAAFRYRITFADGKKAQFDILMTKLERFSDYFGAELPDMSKYQ